MSLSSLSPLSPLLELYRARQRQLLTAVAELTGEASPFYAEACFMASEAASEWATIAEHRGLSIMTVAMVGELNSGKTYLISRLIKDEAARQKLRSGEAQKTERLAWIGPYSPPQLDATKEEYIPVESAAMAPINGGRPYLLLDTPGSIEVAPELRERAHEALLSARVKVLVINESRLEAAGWQDALAGADGSLILPAVHLSAGTTQALQSEPKATHSQLEEDWARVSARLKAIVPDATILNPLWLPEVEAVENGEEQVTRLLEEGLRTALEEAGTVQGQVASQLKAAVRRFEQSLLQKIEADLQPIRERHEKLRATFGSLNLKIVHHLWKDGRAIEALLRHQFQLLLQEQLPGWTFPFPAAARLLCLTSRAWDRLVLGLGGSVPSAIMAGASAWKEIAALKDARSSLDRAMKTEIRELVESEVQRPLDDFQAAIERRFPHSHATTTAMTGEIDFALEGTGQFALHWAAQLHAKAREEAMGSRWVRLMAVLAVCCFWFLLGAPLLHLYGQYVPAAWHSWRGGWESLTRYPQVNFGFWSLAFLLAVLPLFLLALVCVGTALKRRRVKRAQEKLKRHWVERAERGELGITVTPKVPCADAIETLIRWELP